MLIEFDGKLTERKLRFTDVLLTRSVSKMVTSAYRKVINNNINLEWNIFVLVSWKRQPIKSLVELVCTSFGQQTNVSTSD